MDKRYLKMFLKKQESNKNNFFDKVSATFVARNKDGLFFTFFHPKTQQIEKGFIDYKNISVMNNLDIEIIFTPKSIHKVLLTSYKNRSGMYILNYKSLHPEINNKPKKILPTAQHFRTVLKNLKNYIKNRKEKKND